MSDVIRVKKKWLVVSLAAALLALPFGAPAQQAARKPTTTTPDGQLTVDRIYSQPSLSGQLNRGVAWSPDSTRLSFFETRGTGKEAKTDLVVMDAAAGNRTVLVSSEKLESVLPKAEGKDSQ